MVSMSTTGWRRTSEAGFEAGSINDKGGRVRPVSRPGPGRAPDAGAPGPAAEQGRGPGVFRRRPAPPPLPPDGWRRPEKPGHSPERPPRRPATTAEIPGPGLIPVLEQAVIFQVAGEMQAGPGLCPTLAGADNPGRCRRLPDHIYLINSCSISTISKISSEAFIGDPGVGQGQEHPALMG